METLEASVPELEEKNNAYCTPMKGVNVDNVYIRRRDAIMIFHNQGRACHAERSEESPFTWPNPFEARG
jgi:hypothetical protein